MGAKTIIVRNMSGHPQVFEVHGWNNNQNITVPPHGEHKLSAPDGSSGAIIAVHDGKEGEQAEITKNGFGGNDFFDVSVIVGAGGNMICQQVGAPNTRKGDPHFMQNLNEAWKKASQGTRDALKGCVHLRDGKVVRIDACKDHPKLEEFVRTFANGKLYIGIGAWGNNKGNAADNAQSSAAQGNKDILVCYNDGDATPNSELDNATHALAAAPAEPAAAPVAPEHKDEAAPAPAPATEHREEQPAATETEAAAKPAAPSSAAAAALGNATHALADKGPGIELTNKAHGEHTFVFYNNYWNGNGTAGANFDHPDKSVTLKSGQSTFVPLPASFKGRVQHGTQLPCTWVEFQLEAADDHAAHGDISLQQGCDCAATIASTDGSNVKNGFTETDVVAKAPEAAIRKKPNGERAIDTTVGNWNGGPNEAAIDYLNKVVGQRKAYILGGSGTPDVASKNKRLAVVMY